MVSTYGDNPDYGWKPVKPDTMAPDYLTIQKPGVDFLALARAFGVPDGQRVQDPRDVRSALKAGFEHVLNQKRSYVVELFSNPDPKPDQPEPKSVSAAEAALEQPRVRLVVGLRGEPLPGHPLGRDQCADAVGEPRGRSREHQRSRGRPPPHGPENPTPRCSVSTRT